MCCPSLDLEKARNVCSCHVENDFYNGGMDRDMFLEDLDDRMYNPHRWGGNKSWKRLLRNLQKKLVGRGIRRYFALWRGISVVYTYGSIGIGSFLKHGNLDLDGACTGTLSAEGLGHSLSMFETKQDIDSPIRTLPVASSMPCLIGTMLA